MTNRFLCTPDNPWKPEHGGGVAHHGATEVKGTQEDGYPCGDTVRMRCPNCGHEWMTELPQ